MFQAIIDNLLDRELLIRKLLFFTGAILIGIVAISFAVVAEYADTVFHQLFAYSIWWPFLITPLGFIIISILCRWQFAYSEGSGIPQVIAAIKAKEHAQQSLLLSIRVMLGKIVLTILGLFSGASIGREGPTVQIGAAIMHTLKRFGKFPKHDMERGLIIAGGAAGISAAFNTPLAGIVFAIEELSRSYEHRISGTILTAVIISGLVAQVGLGDYTYFGVNHSGINLGWQWGQAVLVAGVIGGLLGGFFSFGLIYTTQKMLRIIKQYPVLLAGLAGLIMAALGAMTHGSIFGSGYLEAKEIIAQKHFEGIDFFAISKMLATFVSYLSGIPGGIFAPSLAAGAGLGHSISWLLPNIDYGTIVILGMAAYFAAIVQSPITAFVIVNEMVYNHALVFPIMATTLIATFFSRILCREPLYDALSTSYLDSIKRR